MKDNTELDFTKPLQLQTNGDKVEVLSKKGRNVRYPILCYFGTSDTVYEVSRDGRVNGYNINEVRVVQAPEKVKLFLNVYRNPNPTVANPFIVVQYLEEGVAKASCNLNANYIGTFPIEWEMKL